MHRDIKGFTLIELLIVIAIIAILSVLVILILNPAELLRQSRDSTRLSDLDTLKRAISLFLTDIATTTMGVAGNGLGNGACYYFSGGGFATTTCLWKNPATTTITAVASKAADGSGWIPINFKVVSTGIPFSNLPSDPTNSGNYFYAYMNGTSTTGFKLAAKMESVKYSASGTKDVVSTDGGTDNNVYEAGTLLTL